MTASRDGGRRDGGVVDRPDPPQLVVPPDERDRRRARGTLERHHAIRRHRLGAALEREAAEGRQRHLLGDEALGRLAEQHVAVARLLLEPRRHVDGVAHHVGVIVARDHLSGVDRDAQTDVARQSGLLGDQLAEGLLHADRGAHGADGVVLGHAGHAEAGEHAVAEKLHDGSAMRFHHRAHRAVVAVHQAAGGLRIQALVQRRRSDQVGEDDRDDLAGLGSGGLRSDQGGAAGVAELRAGLGLAPAGRAARSQRPPAPAAELRTRPVRSPAARAVHPNGAPTRGWAPDYPTHRLLDCAATVCLQASYPAAVFRPAILAA